MTKDATKFVTESKALIEMGAKMIDVETVKGLLTKIDHLKEDWDDVDKARIKSDRKLMHALNAIELIFSKTGGFDKCAKQLNIEAQSMEYADFLNSIAVAFGRMG